MKAISKIMTGAAAAALVTMTAAAPAEARDRYDRYGRYDRNGGIDTGDIITGIAILGGIAAVTSALSRDGNYGRYDRYNRQRYRSAYTNAVNSCGAQAQRYGYGQVSITHADRHGNDRYRVRGVIQDNRYANRGYDQGYDRYGRYDRSSRDHDRHDRYEHDRHDRYEHGYDRYDRSDRYDRYGERLEFSCTAYGNGRIIDFDIDRDRYRRY